MSYVALITGASSGIGEATARLLSERMSEADIILVARRQDRVDALAAELNAGARPDAEGHVFPYAADLTDPAALDRLGAYVGDHFGQLNLLVNNAGARWSTSFAQGGYANVAQTMRINFDAQVQITEVLLGYLRAAVTADGIAQPTVSKAATRTSNHPRAAIVNVGSTSSRVARPGAGAYSASKFALAGWSDALAMELAPEGIHVGLVLPGFIATEGFPQAELVSHPLKRHLVGSAEQAAGAILRAGLESKAEIYVPGFYWVFAAMRTLTPGLIRRALAGGGFTPQTNQDVAEVKKDT
jgi:uncharacterized protein